MHAGCHIILPCLEQQVLDNALVVWAVIIARISLAACLVRPLLESNIVMQAIAGTVVCFATINLFHLVSCSIQLYNNMISLFTQCSGQ